MGFGVLSRLLGCQASAIFLMGFLVVELGADMGRGFLAFHNRGRGEWFTLTHVGRDCHARSASSRGGLMKPFFAIRLSLASA